jgi:Histone methylation protein DOT1.
MKIHAEFGKKSTFIDVGSGLGKPCLHVAQDPGVNFSFGIELSEVRWRLCTDAFNKVIQAAEKQASDNRINHKCFLRSVTSRKLFRLILLRMFTCTTMDFTRLNSAK